MTMPAHRYRPYPAVELADRTWPDRRIERAPQWGSVDLRDGIKQIATNGATWVREGAETLAARTGQSIRYQYSPESYTGTEIDYSLEVCTAVQDVLQPTPDDRLVLNLPATVEMSTPNLYA